MEIRQLRTFCTVAKTHSFTQASELLGYAQSSVSGQIRMLEEQFGTRLFERIGRKVYLTSSGERLKEYAERIIKISDEAQEVVSGSEFPKGKLTIGAPESISIYRLPPILQEYRKLYPEVDIVLKLGACSDLFGWLPQNVIDIALLMDNQISPPDLAVEILRRESMALVSSTDHPLTLKKTLIPTDLEGEHLILIEKDACYRCVFEEQLLAAKVQPGSTTEIGSIETVKKCVISGLGISLLPLMAVEQESNLGLLKVLPWDVAGSDLFTLMIHHKDKWLSPAILAFMELARKNLWLEV